MKEPAQSSQSGASPDERDSVRCDAWLGGHRSLVEEALSLLTLIAALLAWSVEIRWLAWVLFVKAAGDTLTAIRYAVRELKAERKEPPSR